MHCMSHDVLHTCQLHRRWQTSTLISKWPAHFAWWVLDCHRSKFFVECFKKGGAFALHLLLAWLIFCCAQTADPVQYLTWHFLFTHLFYLVWAEGQMMLYHMLVKYTTNIILIKKHNAHNFRGCSSRASLTTLGPPPVPPLPSSCQLCETSRTAKSQVVCIVLLCENDVYN